MAITDEVIESVTELSEKTYKSAFDLAVAIEKQRGKKSKDWIKDFKKNFNLSFRDLDGDKGEATIWFKYKNMNIQLTITGVPPLVAGDEEVVSGKLSKIEYNKEGTSKWFDNDDDFFDAHKID